MKAFLGVAVLAMSLSACQMNAPKSNNFEETPITTQDESEIEKLYNLYLANGGDLSYDEWLASIKGEKGDKGEKGKDGASLLTGNGAPSNNLGNDGDSYVDLSSWDYYVKESGAWVKKGNIKGTQGAQGDAGKDGKDGADGKDGSDGSDGKDGKDGKNGNNGTDGQNGKSAYDLYKEAHPDYQGTLEEWLDDLVNGRLGNQQGGGQQSGGQGSGQQGGDQSGNQNNNPLNSEVVLSNVSTPNMEISFDDITDTCMINQKAKTYIDAMEEQEKTLDKPYHFSSLYGPDDYARIAIAADKGDGVTYAAADTGGVDVCQILSKYDYSNDCKNYPIKLTWNDDGSFDDAKVKFWSTEDKSDLRETTVSVSGGKVTASLENLYRARKYRVQVVNGNQVSQGYEFTTGDYPRTITMGGVHNVRDIGGFMTSYGVRTNQGLIYRGYYIDDKSGGHGINYSDAVQKVQEEVMHIGYEIDLQSTSETNGRTASALNSNVTPCDYKCLTLVSYENFLKQNSYKNLPEIFSIIANADNNHVYFHCWGGADRTGMLAFFINAICGVSYTDLIEDFELTTQTNNKRCHMHNSSSAHYPKFMDAFINGYFDNGITWNGFDPSATVNENCEKWLLDVAHVDAADIERIREIMLPGYSSGNLDAHTLIPSYTASSSKNYDAQGHWDAAIENSNVRCNYARHNVSLDTTDPDYRVANCTQNGMDVYKCSGCNYRYTETVLSYGSHNYQGEVTTEPGCTTPGVMTYTCSGCMDSYTEPIEPAGHDIANADFYVDVEPTCSQTGTGHSLCSRCGQIVYVEIPIVAHEWTMAGQDTTEGKVRYDIYRCTRDGCTAKKIEISAVDDNKVLNGTSKIKSGTPDGYLKLDTEGNSVSYTFNYSGSGTAKLYQRGYMDSWGSNGATNGYVSYSTKKSSQSLSDCGCNFQINYSNSENTETLVQVDEQLRTKTMLEWIDDSYYADPIDGIDSTANSPIVECLIGNMDLTDGLNTFTYARVASYNLVISHFVLVIE